MIPDLDELMGTSSAERKFKALEREFGATMIRQAEIDVLIGLLITAKFISRDNFLELVEKMLHYRDDEKRRQAGMQG